MTVYIDANGNEWDSAESALEDFLSDLPYMTDEDTETVFQFTHYQDDAAANLSAVEYGIVYAGMSDTFAGYPVPRRAAFTVTLNAAGCLPDSDELHAFSTLADAWDFVAGEIELLDEDSDYLAAHTALHSQDRENVGAIPYGENSTYAWRVEAVS